MLETLTPEQLAVRVDQEGGATGGAAQAQLTGEGEAPTLKLRTAVRGHLVEMLNEWAPEEQEELQAAIDHITEILGNDARVGNALTAH